MVINVTEWTGQLPLAHLNLLSSVCNWLMSISSYVGYKTGNINLGCQGKVDVEFQNEV